MGLAVAHPSLTDDACIYFTEGRFWIDTDQIVSRVSATGHRTQGASQRLPMVVSPALALSFDELRAD